jgi:hypothetical protein
LGVVEAQLNTVAQGLYVSYQIGTPVSQGMIGHAVKLFAAAGGGESGCNYWVHGKIKKLYWQEHGKFNRSRTKRTTQACLFIVDCIRRRLKLEDAGAAGSRRFVTQNACVCVVQKIDRQTLVWRAVGG